MVIKATPFILNFKDIFMAMNKKKDISLEREEGKKLYRGIFHFNEVPGGTLTFPLRLYSGPVKNWILKDDTEYKLPKEVIKHINTDSGRYTVHEYVTGENGKPTMKIGRRVARYAFEVTDFFDPGDTSAPEIYIAENSSL